MANAAISDIQIDVTVRVGAARLPIGELLRLGRGSVISLGRGVEEPLEILANGRPVADGRVVLRGECVAVALQK